MTAGEIFELLQNSDRLRVMQQDKEIYVGFLGILKFDHAEILNQVKDKKVVKFGEVPEIRHKRWNELGLDRPLEPDETPDYSFSDLEMKLYYTIHI